MKSSKKNGAFIAGIGYTVGNILIKGINILTLPLFSRLMTTEEFGVYNVFASYDAILFVIVGLALHSSIRSANSTFRGKIDSYTSSVSLIYLINMAVLLGVIAIFGGALSSFLGFDKTVLYMLILYSTGSAILTLYNARISLDYSYKQYLTVAFANSVGNILLSLVLILTAFRGQKDVGRILGATVSIALVAAGILLSMFRKARPRFKKEYWQFGLRYSLPIVPHGISQVLLGQFDRIMIRGMVGDSAAGIYSLAGNIKLILTVISSSISNAWMTWFYGRMDEGNRKDISRRAAQMAALFVILTVGLMAISPELIFILGGKEYELGKYVAIPVIMDGFVMFLYEIIVVGEYYSQRTIFIMFGTIAAAILNIIINYIFILKYGFIAAAYTTLFSYICYLILHLIISRKLLKFHILSPWWILLFSSIVAVMGAADLFLTESLLWRWGLCAAVVIPMTAVLLKWCGGISGLMGKSEAADSEENAQ